MLSVLTRVQEIKPRFNDNAPAHNLPKFEKVPDVRKDKSNVNFSVEQNMVLAFYSPMLAGKNVDKMYENFSANLGTRKLSPWITPGA